MSKVIPYIIAEVTFIPTADGGRKTLPSGQWMPSRYMPHAIADGSDEYLGIQFVDGPSPQFGVRNEFRLALMYHPQVDYTELKTGTMFSVMEGGKKVAIGKVLSRSDD